MKSFRIVVLLLATALSAAFVIPEFSSPDWGFFGHRRINRLAVFTLPPEMMVFFKPHIDWLTDHATDADMRRYASPDEAPRHFIDLDQYGPPFDGLPRSRYAAQVLFTEVGYVTAGGDTLYLSRYEQPVSADLHRAYDRFFFNNVLPRLNGEDFSLDADSVNAFLTVHELGGRAQAAFFSRAPRRTRSFALAFAKNAARSDRGFSPQGQPPHSPPMRRHRALHRRCARAAAHHEQLQRAKNRTNRHPCILGKPHTRAVCR